jgi:hypothetical protein
MQAGIVGGHGYRASQGLHNFCPIVAKIEITWPFFVKFFDIKFNENQFACF